MQLITHTSWMSAFDSTRKAVRSTAPLKSAIQANSANTVAQAAPWLAWKPVLLVVSAVSVVGLFMSQAMRATTPERLVAEAVHLPSFHKESAPDVTPQGSPQTPSVTSHSEQPPSGQRSSTDSMPTPEPSASAEVLEPYPGSQQQETEQPPDPVAESPAPRRKSVNLGDSGKSPSFRMQASSPSRPSQNNPVIEPFSPKNPPVSPQIPEQIQAPRSTTPLPPKKPPIPQQIPEQIQPPLSPPTNSTKNLPIPQQVPEQIQPPLSPLTLPASLKPEPPGGWPNVIANPLSSSSPFRKGYPRYPGHMGSPVIEPAAFSQPSPLRTQRAASRRPPLSPSARSSKSRFYSRPNDVKHGLSAISEESNNFCSPSSIMGGPDPYTAAGVGSAHSSRRSTASRSRTSNPVPQVSATQPSPGASAPSRGSANPSRPKFDLEEV